jgi:lipid-binding SYLF domain-containing protein
MMTKLFSSTLTIGGLLLAVLLAGCASSAPSKPKPAAVLPSSGVLSEKAKQEQRQAILKIRTQTLNQLYKLKPPAQTEIEQAAGYGVFEINGLNAILAEKHGRGMVMERNGKVTYMQLARTDIGPDATVQPYWQVMVFRDSRRLSQFALSGSPADVSSDPSITVYQLNEQGVSTQADGGARYYRDPNLN